jgi:hypothetical protein
VKGLQEFGSRFAGEVPGYPGFSPGGSACRKDIPARYKPAARRALLWRGRTGRAHRSPLLKTFAAIDGAPLRGLERDRCFLPALRANGLGFDSLNARRSRSIALRTVGLARLTPLGFVLETLVGEKHLFAGGENELSSTFGALQDLIVVFHVLLRDLAGRVQAALQPWSDDIRNTRAEHAIPTCRLAQSCLIGPK